MSLAEMYPSKCQGISKVWSIMKYFFGRMDPRRLKVLRMLTRQVIRKVENQHLNIYVLDWVQSHHMEQQTATNYGHELYES
jgi:hypothetical protein